MDEAAGRRLVCIKDVCDEDAEEEREAPETKPGAIKDSELAEDAEDAEAAAAGGATK